MKRRITACFLMVVLCIALVLATSAQGGSSSDPVVSKSYVDGTFFESVIAAARAKAESSVSSFKNKCKRNKRLQYNEHTYKIIFSIIQIKYSKINCKGYGN